MARTTHIDVVQKCKKKNKVHLWLVGLSILQVSISSRCSTRFHSWG